MPAPLTPEVRALLLLHLVPGLGPVRTAALLERFGSAEAVLRAGREQLLEVDHVGPKLAADLVSAVREADIDAEIRLMEKHNTRLLVHGTPEYPQPLAEIADAPHLVYVRGGLEPRDAKAVGIVGTRHPTAYGKRMTEHLAAGLARAGYTVISGLPLGTSLLMMRSGRRWIKPRLRTLLKRGRPCRSLPCGRYSNVQSIRATI
jgi:DNA processing protein